MDKYATPERIQSLFQRFDTNSNNTISGSNLRDAFTKLGHHMGTTEIEDIMNEHDIDHEHVITFEDFRRMLLDNM